MKQEIDYADLVNKNNIYNNLLQKIPKYIFLGNNSGLDNNNFEYLFVLSYFSFQLETPETQVKNNIFEELDIKRVIHLDL
jgi:hypothetical protein